MKKTSQVISYYTTHIAKYNKDCNVLFWFLEELSGLSKSQIIISEFLEIDFIKLDGMINDYCSGVSAQYILGYSYFLNRKFDVCNSVLIPRNETEEVVLCAIDLIKANNVTRVCEIGCGSGVIAISLSLECDICVDAVDISSDALSVSKTNCKKLNACVNFYKGNILDPIIKNDYEMIVSNPPYIPKQGYVDKETLENEPSIALFGGEDGLDFYREIIEKAKNFTSLKYIVFEIGFDQADAIRNIANCDVEIRKDINGNDRIMILYL